MGLVEHCQFFPPIQHFFGTLNPLKILLTSPYFLKRENKKMRLARQSFLSMLLAK